MIEKDHKKVPVGGSVWKSEISAFPVYNPRKVDPLAATLATER